MLGNSLEVGCPAGKIGNDGNVSLVGENTSSNNGINNVTCINFLPLSYLKRFVGVMLRLAKINI